MVDIHIIYINTENIDITCWVKTIQKDINKRGSIAEKRRAQTIDTNNVESVIDISSNIGLSMRNLQNRKRATQVMGSNNAPGRPFRG